MKRVLNIDEACEFLGYKKKTIYSFTSLGIIPYSKPNGKKLYFDRELLEKWMLSNASKNNIDKIGETFVALD